MCVRSSILVYFVARFALLDARVLKQKEAVEMSLYGRVMKV